MKPSCSHRLRSRALCRWLKIALTSILLVAFSGACMVPSAHSETATSTSDLTEFKARLQQLRSATDIVLMIVPWHTFFRARVNEGRLANAACVYQITSGKGPSFGEALDILGGSVTEYQVGPERGQDLRVGIVFRSGGKILQDFYFNDWGGAHEVKGFSGDHQVSASADLPDRLRALLTRQDVVLIKDRYPRCPHS
jgi:hypothetical protein